MTVKILKYSDSWSDEILACPACGWRGSFEKGRTMFYQALIESSCPKCDHGVLAMVPFPSTQAATPLFSGKLKAECKLPGPGSRGFGFRIGFE
jgi:hypothetical protein